MWSRSSAIWNAVGSRQAVGLEGVAKSLGALFPGEHHLVDGVGAGGCVLQQVGGIVPPTAHVDSLSLARGMVPHISIVCVATVAHKRVVAASLLPHVVQDEVGRAVVHISADGKRRRHGAGSLHIVTAWAREGAEIEATRGAQGVERATLGHGAAVEHHLAGVGVDQLKCGYLNVVVAEENRHLHVVGQIPQLVNADKRARRNCGHHEQHRQSQQHAPSQIKRLVLHIFIINFRAIEHSSNRTLDVASIIFNL